MNRIITVRPKFEHKTNDGGESRQKTKTAVLSLLPLAPAKTPFSISLIKHKSISRREEDEDDGNNG